MAKTKEIPSVEQGWEIKDRTYLVTGRYKPLTLRIPSKHSAKVPPEVQPSFLNFPQAYKWFIEIGGMPNSNWKNWITVVTLKTPVKPLQFLF